MPLRFRAPFVICVLPGALCGDGENREFRTVVPRLTLPRGLLRFAGVNFQVADY